MRAIVKPENVAIEIEPNVLYSYQMESINEDEWVAEIYALLLIESGVIYESFTSL